MITREELIEFVKTRSWYQSITFEPDVVSRGYGWCGDPAWSNIVKLLPESLEGKRVLDLGHNAGIFCVRSALMGAREVVGVDWEGWRPNWDFIEQADFVKKYFEQKHDKQLNITYNSGKMQEFLTKGGLGRFDYVYAIASIYYTDNADITVKAISEITDNVIIRLRDGHNAVFTSLLKKYNYKEVRVIREEWWKKLDKQTDDFYLYLYSK